MIPLTPQPQNPLNSYLSCFINKEVQVFINNNILVLYF